MNDILDRYDQDERIDREWPPMARDASATVVRHLPPPGSRLHEGVITFANLDTSTADKVVREQIAFFGARGLAVSWKVYGHDSPADLGQRLEEHGFAPEEQEAIMVLDLGSIPADLASVQTADIRAVRDPAELGQVQEITRTVWNDPMQDLFDELAYVLEHKADRLSVYLGLVDGVPVSAAWLQMPARGRFASLWGGSTLPEFRGRGLYTALLAVRAQEAAARGYEFVTVDAGPMSGPIVERFGFREITTARDYAREAPQQVH